MLRTVCDFLNRWQEEKESTLRVFQNLTDDSLREGVSKGRTIGRLANHIIETLSEMPHQLGLPVEERHTTYRNVANILAAYERAANELSRLINENWTDNTLNEETLMYGEPWKNGFSLWV